MRSGTGIWELMIYLRNDLSKLSLYYNDAEFARLPVPPGVRCLYRPRGINYTALPHYKQGFLPERSMK